MTRTTALFLAMCLLALQVKPARGLDVPPCTLMGNSTPPLSIVENGQLSGASVVLFNAILEEAGMPAGHCNLLGVPWARGLQYLATRKAQIMSGVARTPARENLYKWVGPVLTVHMSLIGRKGHFNENMDYSDLNDLSIGTLRGSAPEKILLGLNLPRVHLEPTSDPKLNIQKLVAGRIDLVAHVYAPLAWEMRKMGIDSEDFTEFLIMATTDLYYAFSKDFPDSSIELLQAALDGLRSTGEIPSHYERIMKSHKISVR